jgi:hypothetical protein
MFMTMNQLFYEGKTGASDDTCWTTGKVLNQSFSTILVTQAEHFSIRTYPNGSSSAQPIVKRRRRANKYVQNHSSTLRILTLPHLTEYMHPQNRLMELDTVKSSIKDTPNTK